MDMKIFEVEFNSSSASGIAIVVCNNENDIIDCLIERGYKHVKVDSHSEINAQKVSVTDLTAGDLIKLLK